MLENFITLKFDLKAVSCNNNNNIIIKMILNNNNIVFTQQHYNSNDNDNNENNINKTAIIVTTTYQGSNNNGNIFGKILFYINRALLIQLSNRQSDITEPLSKGISIHCCDIKQ